MVLAVADPGCVLEDQHGLVIFQLARHNHLWLLLKQRRLELHWLHHRKGGSQSTVISLLRRHIQLVSARCRTLEVACRRFGEGLLLDFQISHCFRGHSGSGSFPLQLSQLLKDRGTALRTLVTKCRVVKHNVWDFRSTLRTELSLYLADSFIGAMWVLYLGRVGL